MEKIKSFVKINSFFNGNGYVNGYDGDGNGYGNGYDGYEGDDGYGDGNIVNGYDGDDGDGGLKSLNNQTIYLIDGVQTIISSVKNNIAKGFIVNNDLSLEPCYIAKGENQFAHGATIKQVIADLQTKLLENLSIEERIIKFKKHFSSLTKKYKALDFYSWHTSLTGSCDLGKKSFVSNKNIDLEKDKFTVFEFIELVKNAYGSEVFTKLKQSYEV